MNPATALPEGPSSSRLRQTVHWIRDPFDFMDRNRAEFGPTFTMQLAQEGDWVMTGEPELIKAIFTGDPKVLHAGEGNQILSPVLGRESVLVLDREQHMTKRKLMLPPFHGERMRRFGDLIGEITAAEVARWPEATPIQLLPRMQALTLEVIMRAVFGIEDAARLDALRDPLRKLLAKLTSQAGFAIPLLLGGRGADFLLSRDRMLKAAHAILLEEIALRRRDPNLDERVDILSTLVAARDSDGNSMSDSELRDQAMTLLLAGHETTATALSWAFERLVRHPDKLARLSEEARAGEGPYVDAVITETLRMRPVISIVVRRLKADFQLGDHLLPKGAAVIPSIYLVHHDPDIYPDPRAFKPERFVGVKPGTYTWIPFGGGVRRCLGASFAQYEMRVVLTSLAANLRLRAVDPAAERVKRRAITHSPGRGATVEIERVGAPAVPESELAVPAAA